MNIQLIKSALGISYYIQTEAWSVRRLCPQPGDELTGAGVMVSVLGRVCHTGAAGEAAGLLRGTPGLWRASVFTWPVFSAPASAG